MLYLGIKFSLKFKALRQIQTKDHWKMFKISAFSMISSCKTTKNKH